jgi:23S rRNA (uridine2552-2'-O)-methyltransferase
MSKQWLRSHKQDSYYKKAKTNGYRSRAAFKLRQINNKFKVIRQGNIVLDLGAAPGGWSQVAVQIVGETGNVIGVDLDPITKVENAIFIVGDMTAKKTLEAIREHIDDNGVDVVISDAAPNISGNYSIDQAKSVYLAETALDIAKQLLIPNGNFIVKVFEGEDFQQFFKQVKEAFFHAKKYSPKASRARSSEIYVIGLGFKQKKT